MVNCDQVFTILTRGPFPSGESTDAAVEIHLSSCNDCRRFAEALRPDGVTSEESLVPEESRGLPYYWGVSVFQPLEAEAEQEQGTLVATVRGHGHRLRRRRRVSLFDRHEPLSYLSGWQLAIAVLMGAVLGAALKLLGYADDGPAERAFYTHHAPATIPAANATVMLPSNAKQQLAAKLGVAPACWQDQQIGVRSEVPEGQLAEYYSLSRNADLCCTKCHNATAPRFALRGTTARISRSCQVCHSDAPINHFGHPVP